MASAWFGAKPELVIKAGFVAHGVSGSGSGSTRLTQPRVYRPYFGGLGDAPALLSRIFVAHDALDSADARDDLPKGLRYAAIKGSRGLTRADMNRNIATPTVMVPREPGPVVVDGAEVSMEPATRLPLSQLHHFA